ncbi:MAG: Uma2 family endonuclease [Alkalinema sp. RU_4_3]|nr:Uma2 family endonuclease [Alkalinema sp. RU_4_3]
MVSIIQKLADEMPDARRFESDEPEMESSLHYIQLMVLVASLELLWHNRTDFFLGANLTVYFSRQQLKNRDFRGPDLFLVQDTERKPRKSWVVWEEDGKYPDLIIELLSDSTAEVDRSLKKELYQNSFHTYEYFWFSPETMEFQGFRLVNRRYQPIPTDAKGHRWSEVLNLYLGISDSQLRYFLPNGDLVPTPSEEALQQRVLVQQHLQFMEQQKQEVDRQRQIIDQQTQETDRQRQRADQLAERLRSLGLDPED